MYRKTMALLSSNLSCCLIKLISIYQWIISPWLGRNCRFTPSCSDYAKMALQRHGCFRGLWLSGLRLLRCQPLSSPGFDPVPECCSTSKKQGSSSKKHSKTTNEQSYENGYKTDGH